MLTDIHTRVSHRIIMTQYIRYIQTQIVSDDKHRNSFTTPPKTSLVGLCKKSLTKRLYRHTDTHDHRQQTLLAHWQITSSPLIMLADNLLARMEAPTHIINKPKRIQNNSVPKTTSFHLIIAIVKKKKKKIAHTNYSLQLK